MSLLESFTRGHRDAEFWHALASKGSVTGRGLLNMSVDVKEASADDLRTEGATDWGYVIPHTASPADAKTALLRMIAAAEKTDEELINEVTISSCRMMHAPVLIFGCRYDTEWTAAVGFDRNEYYTDTQRYYDSKSEEWREKHVTKTNIVTDWQLSQGTDNDDYSEIGYAGSPLPAEVVKWIEAAEFSMMEPLSARQLADFDRLPHTQDAQAVFERGIEARAEQAIEMGVRACLQGDRVRDCQWTTRLDAMSINALIPICHITFVIRGETLNFWAYGPDLSKAWSDPLPVARKKGKESAKMAPVGYALFAAMIATFAVAERTKEGVLAWAVLFIAIFIYASGKQSAYTAKLKHRRESGLQARLLQLENCRMNHDVADVDAASVVDYEPETVDKVATTYIPALLVFALVLTIYRSYAGHSTALDVDRNRAATITSKSAAVPATLPKPAIKAAEPHPSGNSGSLPQPQALNQIAAPVEGTKKNLEQDVAGPSTLRDAINLLSPAEAERIRGDLRTFQAKTGFSFGIIITDQTIDGDFADFGVPLCNEWAARNPQTTLASCVVVSKTKIGKTDFYFNVAKQVGTKITEAETLKISQNTLEPALKDGEIYRALHETVEAVQARIAAEATKVVLPQTPDI